MFNDAFEAIHDSKWSTANLAAWALNWNGFQDNPYALVRPIWKNISHSHEAAQAFYAGVNHDELRILAAEALASSGWTLSRINYRKS